MISLIESIHKRDIIHGYISPKDFLLGRDSKKFQVYLISFGNSKYYKEPNTNIDIKSKGGANFISKIQPVFCSINQLKNQVNTKRDDIEAIGYILVFFLKGEFPWFPVKGNLNNEIFEKWKKIKLNTPLDDLCKDCPKEFKLFIQYSRKLGFTERTHFDILRTLLEDVNHKNNLVVNYNKFDWMEKKSSKYECI